MGLSLPLQTNVVVLLPPFTANEEGHVRGGVAALDESQGTFHSCSNAPRRSTGKHNSFLSSVHVV